MHPDTFLFRYKVRARYLGKGTYPISSGSEVGGILAFNFDTGTIRLSIKLYEKAFEFVYNSWEAFEAEWKVLEREASLAAGLL